MRKCWNCGQPTTDNDLRVCTDPICGKAAISLRHKTPQRLLEGQCERCLNFKEKPKQSICGCRSQRCSTCKSVSIIRECWVHQRNPHWTPPEVTGLTDGAIVAIKEEE